MLHHLGHVCRHAREGAGIRQIDIATRAGTTHSSISRFERGDLWPRNPDAWITAYAIELGVDAIDLWRAAVEAWAGAGS